MGFTNARDDLGLSDATTYLEADDVGGRSREGEMSEAALYSEEGVSPSNSDGKSWGLAEGWLSTSGMTELARSGGGEAERLPG